MAPTAPKPPASLAAAAPVQTPNLYALSGHGVHVTYATTAIDGKPHFTYHDTQRTLTFTGDAIRTADTEIGTLVSVSLVRTVDTGSTSFTVLVPRVNLGPATSVPITTVGITTVHRFSVVPAFNLGQTELYGVTSLSGTASAVVF